MEKESITCAMRRARAWRSALNVRDAHKFIAPAALLTMMRFPTHGLVPESLQTIFGWIFAPMPG